MYLFSNASRVFPSTAYFSIQFSYKMERPRRKHTTRDERRDIQVLREAGKTLQQISDQAGLSVNQVSYALQQPATPSKRSGRPSKLTEAQVNKLIEYIESSQIGRQTAWNELPEALGWENISIVFEQLFED
jgi:transposase